MAYSANTTITHLGGRDYIIIITELEAGAATETAITGLPVKGRIVAQRAQLISGSAASIDPVIGTATNPAANFNNLILSNGTAAAGISNLALPEIPYYAATSLFHRSVCDTGADNSIVTTYLLKAGW